MSTDHPSNEGSSSTRLSSHPEMDLAQVHGSLFPEHKEPRESEQQVPLWLMTCFFAVVFWGGSYLFYYSGGFRADVFDENQVVWGPVKTAGPAKPLDPVALGQRVFTARCAACHQTTGLGQPGQYPPQAGSEWAQGPAHRVVAIVLNGLDGPLHVKGEVYNNSMPTWKDILSDQQIAAVLTYIRQAWGNQAPPISPAEVTAMRSKLVHRLQPWTEKELLALPAEDLPPAAPPVGY